MSAGAEPRGIALVLFLFVALFAARAAADTPAGAKAARTVKIEAMAFVPPTIEITAGESVTWENLDLVPHTATSKSAGFDSGLIAAPGGAATSSWSHTFKTKGSFEYVCTYHPTMKAKVIVK